MKPALEWRKTEVCMKIKFLGAAGTVTGSKYLLKVRRKKFLVDCGLFQGAKELRQRNWRDFDVDPESISAIFVTHAHIDHTGYIPRLVKMGFAGPIYCSSGTYELAKILLPDSGHLQEEEANYANKKGYSKHKPALPLYTREDAEYCLKYFRPVDFHQAFKADRDVTVTFNRAGHILGASCLLVEAQGKRIAFSGDVGRFNDLIMHPPEPMFDADYLVIESTYGDREHIDEDLFKKMAHIINSTAENGGVIVIPSFAVGRAQHVLYMLHELKRANRIPDIVTFLDSPMAIDTTDLYSQYHNEHRLSRDVCKAVFSTAIITRTSEESRAINDVPGPKIIISASGMAVGGRILHHLAQYISDAKNTVVIVGYQAEGTRGRALIDGATQIKIFGQYYEVGARIENLLGLSAHSDRNDLIRWLKNSPIDRPRVFVTHGEPEASHSFAKMLRETFNWHVDVPEDGEEFTL